MRRGKRRRRQSRGSAFETAKDTRRYLPDLCCLHLTQEINRVYCCHKPWEWQTGNLVRSVTSLGRSRTGWQSHLWRSWKLKVSFQRDRLECWRIHEEETAADSVSLSLLYVLLLTRCCWPRYLSAVICVSTRRGRFSIVLSAVLFAALPQLNFFAPIADETCELRTAHVVSELAGSGQSQTIRLLCCSFLGYSSPGVAHIAALGVFNSDPHRDTDVLPKSWNKKNKTNGTR